MGTGAAAAVQCWSDFEDMSKGKGEAPVRW